MVHGREACAPARAKAACAPVTSSCRHHARQFLAIARILSPLGAVRLMGFGPCSGACRSVLACASAAQAEWLERILWPSGLRCRRKPRFRSNWRSCRRGAVSPGTAGLTTAQQEHPTMGPHIACCEEIMPLYPYRRARLTLISDTCITNLCCTAVG